MFMLDGQEIIQVKTYGFKLGIADFISIFPASLANFLSVLYLSLPAKPNQMALHDLLRSKYAEPTIGSGFEYRESLI